MDRLPLFLNLHKRRIAVVGGGSLAARRMETLARAGAEVWLFATAWSDEFEALRGQYRLGDLDERNAFFGFPLAYFAFEASEEPEKPSNLALIARARACGALVNVADHPGISDFIVPSVLDRSPLVVAICTGGDAPLLGRMLKARLETLIPAAYGRLAALAGEGRAALAGKLTSHQSRLRFWERIYDGPITEMILAGDEPGAKALLDREIAECRPNGSAADDHPVGEVYLVGAGPGDPDLLTFRAFRLMQKADVVLYDRLVDPAIMDRVRRDAERIYVGKKRSDHALPQEEIGDLMVKLALEGKRVLRLKGGDPFIFGRGGEEIEKLAEKRIPFQVCPGITAAAGCSSYAGIPLTHRDTNQAVTFVTGHDMAGELPGALDWGALARGSPVIVFYMALGHLAEIVERLLAGGRRRGEPVAIISKATTPEQRVVVSRLDAVVELCATIEIAPPALVVVGETVALRDRLDWLSNIPQQKA